MNYEEFVQRVGTIGKAGSLEVARRITEAFFETLGERLTRSDRAELGSQLPHELKEFLNKRSSDDVFLRDVFYLRIQARSDLGSHDTARMAQAVAETLSMAVSPGLLNFLRSHLPAEYGELLGKKPQPE